MNRFYILKHNPYHDKRGRFTTATGAVSLSSKGKRSSVLFAGLQMKAKKYVRENPGSQLIERMVNGKPLFMAIKPIPNKKKSGKPNTGDSGNDSALKKTGNPGSDPSYDDVSLVGRALGWNVHDLAHGYKFAQDNTIGRASDIYENNGFTYDDSYMAIHNTWNDTSNGTYAAINMQKSASEEFGVPMSKWQEKRYGISSGSSEKIRLFGDDETPDNRDDLISKERKFLRTMYNETQKRLKNAGIDKVTVYRGVKNIGDKIPAGQQAKLTSNTLESWTLDKGVAESSYFSGDGGNVIRMEVPVERVLSSYATGFGTEFEKEVVIFGNSNDVGVVVG